MKLRFAASDARLLAETFQTKSKGVFSEIETRILTDSAATKKGIQDGLDWLKSKMTAKDVGIFVFSGHGTRDPFGHFYLVPVDISETDPAGTCFSGDEFKSRLEQHARAARRHPGCLPFGNGRREEPVPGSNRRSSATSSPTSPESWSCALRWVASMPPRARRPGPVTSTAGRLKG